MSSELLLNNTQELRVLHCQEEKSLYLELQSFKQYSTTAHGERESHCVKFTYPCADATSDNTELNELLHASPISTEYLSSRSWSYLINTIYNIVEEQRNVSTYHTFIRRRYEFWLNLFLLQIPFSLILLFILNCVRPITPYYLIPLYWCFAALLIMCGLFGYKKALQHRLLHNIADSINTELSRVGAQDREGFNCYPIIVGKDDSLWLLISYPSLPQQCGVCQHVQQTRNVFCTECGCNLKARELN